LAVALDLSGDECRHAAKRVDLPAAEHGDPGRLHPREIPSPCCFDSWVVPIKAGTMKHGLERAGAAE